MKLFGSVLPNRRYGFKFQPKIAAGDILTMTNFVPMAMFHQSQCLVNICCASKKNKEHKMIVTVLSYNYKTTIFGSMFKNPYEF